MVKNPVKNQVKNLVKNLVKNPAKDGSDQVKNLVKNQVKNFVKNLGVEVFGFIRKMRLNFSTRFFAKFPTRFSGVSFGEVLMEVQEVVASRVIAGGHCDGHLRGPFGALVRDVFSEGFFLRLFENGEVRITEP